MSTSKRETLYDEEFKHTLVNLYQNGNKSQAALCKEYGISINTLGHWIKQYSLVEMDNGEGLTAKQVRELQKQDILPEDEEELLIKKQLPSSHHTHTTIKCCS